MAGAWTVRELGEPGEVLFWESVPDPQPGAGEVRVRVNATSCNFADVLLCRGQYQVKPAMPFTPGLELCGIVDAVGPGVQDHLLGQRIVGQPNLPRGGFAELSLMDAAHAVPVPDEIDDAVAATLHLTYLTAWLALHRRTQVGPGTVVVVTAAAGGVGSAAVQLARAAGATVIGMASSEAKLGTVRALGVDLAIDGSRDDVIDRVHEIAPAGADVVFETVGGAAYDAATKYIAFEGTIVVVGFAGGTIPQPRLNHAFVKNYTIAGLHWSLYRRYQPSLLQQAQSHIFEMAVAGAVDPLITSTVDMEDLPSALAGLAAGTTKGKTVVCR